MLSNYIDYTTLLPMHDCTVRNSNLFSAEQTIIATKNNFGECYKKAKYRVTR